MPHQRRRSLARNDSFARAAAQVRLGSSGRPAPTHRLPIKSRRGRCPHRPARQTQRFPPSRQASTGAERVAELDAESMRRQGRISQLRVRVAERDRYNQHLNREKDSKTMGFGGVLFSLSFAAERKGATGGVMQGDGLPHQRRRSLARNDTLQEMQRITGDGVRAARPTDKNKNFGGAGRCGHRPLRRVWILCKSGSGRLGGRPLRNNNGKRGDKSKTGG